MACKDNNIKKNREYMEKLAAKVAKATDEPQQIYSTITWDGEIFDFEAFGIPREKIVSIIKVDGNLYEAKYEA